MLFSYLARIATSLEAIAKSKQASEGKTGLGSMLAPKKLSVGRFTREGKEYCWSLDGKPTEAMSLTGTIDKLSSRELVGTQHGDLTMAMLYLKTDMGLFILETMYPNYFGKNLVTGLSRMTDDQLKGVITITVEACETESERGKKVIYGHLFDTENNVIDTIFDKKYKKGYEDYWLDLFDSVRSRILALPSTGADNSSTAIKIPVSNQLKLATPTAIPIQAATAVVPNPVTTIETDPRRENLLRNIATAIDILGWGNKQGSDEILKLFPPAKTRAELSNNQLARFLTHLNREVDKLSNG